MRNINLPAPVLAAVVVVCLLAGFLLGIVFGPDQPDRNVGTVKSYDRSSQRLCLTGDAVKDQKGADEDGVLCGTWRRSPGADDPKPGDSFRFAAEQTSKAPEGVDPQSGSQVLLYGDVTE